MEPDESLCVDEAAEEEEEDIEEDEEPVDEEEEEVSAEEERKRKPSSRAPARNSTSGRPRRATAGKKMSAYVDFSSSDESERQAVPAKRKRNDGSESGSDYNPSGGNSDSDGARGGVRKALARGGRGGRPVRKSWKKNSDSEEDDFDLSDADSDVPKRKRATPGKRGRPAVAATTKRGTRGRAAKATKSRKRKDSESEEEVSEEEEEEELSDFGSDQSEEEESKKFKKPPAPVKNAKTNNKAKTPVKPAGRPKKSSKKEEEEESDDEDEPLNKKGKATFPTDEQIRNYVKEILDKANLEEITMKTVCKQVYAKYPDFDLTDKKDFIKATVKALIAA
ncbi:PREDICTED: protein DEK-like [Rhagoletis zephyria]|nr:PREDICTED: protein DEK-like [Rhagoletis zephyria]